MAADWQLLFMGWPGDRPVDTREPAAGGPTVTVPGAFTTAAITLGVLITLLLGIVPTLALTWAGGGPFVS